MSVYATYQNVEARVQTAYVGTAVKATNSTLTDDDVAEAFTQGIVVAGYTVPFIGVFLTICALFFIIISASCIDNSFLDEIFKIIRSDTKLQANVVATLLLCSLFTVYICALDLVSVIMEDREGVLPSYYPPKHYLFYAITIVFGIVSFASLVTGVVLFIIATCFLCKNYDTDDSPVTLFCLSVLFIVGSTVLSLSFHFQSILLSWATNPFYASRIAIFYGIVLFIYFISFKSTYTMMSSLIVRPMMHNMAAIIRKKWFYCSCVLVSLSLLTTFVIVTGVLIAVTIFVFLIPINYAIEESVSGVATIYNSAVLLIAGLIAYNVGWHNFGHVFSLESALRKALHQMNIPTLNSEKWKQLTDEEKMIKVIKTLIYKETSTAHYDDDFFMELKTAEDQVFQTCIIDALTPCVKRKLTHIVNTTLTQPQMPAAFRADGVQIVFIAPLVNVLSEAVTAAAGTSLRGDGQITTRIKTETYTLTLALISSLIPTLTDVVKVNEMTILPASQVIEQHDVLKDSMKRVLVDALNCNPSSPSLNNERLKVIIESALIPQNPPVVVVEGDEGDNGRGVDGGEGGGGGNGGGGNEGGGGGENGEEGGGGGENGEGGGGGENGEEGGGGENGEEGGDRQDDGEVDVQ